MGGNVPRAPFLEATIWLGHSLIRCVDAGGALVIKEAARRQLGVDRKGNPISPGGATQFILVAEPLAESCQGHPGGYLWCEFLETAAAEVIAQVF